MHQFSLVWVGRLVSSLWPLFLVRRLASCILLLLWMGGLQTLVFNFSLGWLMRFVFCLTSRSSDYEIYLVFPLDREYMRYDVSCLSFGVRKGHEIYLLPLPCACGSGERHVRFVLCHSCLWVRRVYEIFLVSSLYLWVEKVCETCLMPLGWEA